jgi:hypothetical protein
MAVYHWDNPDEIKAYSKVCNEHDYNAPKDLVLDVIKKGLDLMAATQRYSRMFVLCGDKKERPDGFAECWVIQRQNDGSYEVSNDEGLEGLIVSDAYNVIFRAMKNKVIGDVSLKSANSVGKEDCTTLYYLDSIWAETSDKPSGVVSGQVRHDAATTIQKAFRHCITDPKHPMTQRRLMREFAEMVS